jgi:hypothetical protein
MEKREPKIFADGMTNEAILEWMKNKVSAARRLQTALAEREIRKQALAELDNQIEELTSEATLEVRQSS